MVRAAAARSRALSFAKAISMGLKSGAVRRQVAQARAGGLDRLSDAMDLVSWQIVHDHDVAWPQLGNERLFDIGEKGFAVHRAVEDHRRSDAVVTQPSGEGGGFPMAMGHGGAASLAPGRTTVKARHLGVRGGLVDEDDPRRIEVELSFKPRLARRVHRAAALFGGVRRLFFARDLAPFEEPPERADGDGDAALPQPLLQFRQRNVALGG